MQATIDPTAIDAVVFDMDGVITDTARVHAAAWKELFDVYLRERAEATGEEFAPFTADDYRRYVDGKPRYDGVASFLESRGVTLPTGRPDDPPDAATVCGLGNRKNRYFLRRLREDGADAYESSVELVGHLRAAGVGAGVISASRNAAEVLEAAGLGDLFEVRVDGRVAEEMSLPGKPDPAVFVEAARRLGTGPDRTAVVEDAIAGVAAGRRGDFACVIGVDRTGHAAELREAGADVVVADLGEVAVLPAGGGSGAADDPNPGAGRAPRIADLPDALEREDEIHDRVDGRHLVVFLDYDGTLTPIVEDPAAATLPPATGQVIRRLAEHVTVAVVSGRDLDDVRGMVGIETIPYAGSHGFDLVEADGTRHERAREALPALDAAEHELAEALDHVDGARVERKRFAIAVHYRQVDDTHVADVERAVDEVAGRYEDLRKTGGKRIFELRPDIDWHKGKALRWFLATLDLDRPDVVPLYVGDDVTDEDAFGAIAEDGIAVMVRGEDDARATAAHYALDDPDAVRRFLQRLVDMTPG